MSDDNKIGEASQFVFPIYADDLTIKGNGNVVITSSFNPGKTSGGNWHNQNFITIAGNNVLIENIKLKGNPNEYYDNQCNKVIELVNPATNLTLENAELLPIADSNGKINSGSIYIASTNPGYVEIKDVKMYSWISARSATSGKVQIKNVIQDFTNNTYAGYSYNGSWGWNPGVSGSAVDLQDFTIIVDDNINLAKQVFNTNLKPGTTIELASDIYLDEKLNIGEAPNTKVSGVVLDGKGHMITASENFQNNTTANPEQLISVENSNIEIKDITIKTTDKNTHALNLYQNEKVVLSGNVVLDNSASIKGAPLMVNGGEAVVNGDINLVVGENSWYGANVDKEGELIFEPNSSFEMTNNSGNDDLALLLVEKGTISNPENADLVSNGDGTYSKEEPVAPIEYHDLHIAKSVGAKLVSRYDKNRTPDGGSFTLSLEKEEGYEGCEPTVYYKRGRLEDWKELKLDEVSGYYQIRNVYTDIYVKVSGDGIWPVSNEEVEAQEVKVYTLDHKIVVSTPSMMDVQIISMTGVQVASDKVARQREFHNISEGIYIVKVGDKIIKVKL